jgi:hypothetical protein
MPLRGGARGGRGAAAGGSTETAFRPVGLAAAVGLSAGPAIRAKSTGPASDVQWVVTLSQGQNITPFPIGMPAAPLRSQPADEIIAPPFSTSIDLAKSTNVRPMILRLALTSCHRNHPVSVD